MAPIWIEFIEFYMFYTNCSSLDYANCHIAYQLCTFHSQYECPVGSGSVDLFNSSLNRWFKSVEIFEWQPNYKNQTQQKFQKLLGISGNFPTIHMSLVSTNAYHLDTKKKHFSKLFLSFLSDSFSRHRFEIWSLYKNIRWIYKIVLYCVCIEIFNKHSNNIST